jgi:hypothetical protein
MSYPSNPGDRSSAQSAGLDLAVAALAACLAAGACLALDDAFAHWFLIPVAACGVVALFDAMPWLSGRCDILQASAVFGMYGVFFFFFAPLAHVAMDVWMRYIVPPDDWRPWLGGMAALNFVGLLLYKAAGARRSRAPALASVWTLDHKRFWPMLGGAAAVCLTAQAYLWARTGGISGYIAKYEESLIAHEDLFAGMGWIVILGESFPGLVFLGFLVVARQHGRLRQWSVIAPVLLAAIGLQFLFGGFRGSRANTVWFAVWAIGATHCWLRKTPRAGVVAGAAAIFAFTFLLGFAKDLGFATGAAIRSADDIADLSERTGRTPEASLLGDFGRSDVQAYQLYRIVRQGGEFEAAWGRTYLGNLAMLIPRAIWPERPPGKTKWTTETEYGSGTYPALRSSRIYGLSGEFALNFGPWLAPLSFLFMAGGVRRADAVYRLLPEADPRRILFPFAIVLLLMLLAFDSDNCVWFLIKFVSVPGSLLFLASDRLRAGAEESIELRSPGAVYDATRLA